jgi:hypothetical protein
LIIPYRFDRFLRFPIELGSRPDMPLLYDRSLYEKANNQANTSSNCEIKQNKIKVSIFMMNPLKWLVTKKNRAPRHEECAASDVEH